MIVSSPRPLTGILSPIGASPAFAQERKSLAKKVTLVEPVSEDTPLTRSQLRHQQQQSPVSVQEELRYRVYLDIEPLKIIIMNSETLADFITTT